MPVSNDDRQPGRRLIAGGLVVVGAAVIGGLGTAVGAPVAAQPDGVEDLTAVWSAAGPTPPGGTASVLVPPGQTLVAFLVGTDLRGIAGTTTGTCAADADGSRLRLDWPVLLDFSVTGPLAESREAVAVDGWRNDGSSPRRVSISCDSADSGVEYFVAVPSTRAALPATPWFQPWGWVALGTLGALIVAAGAVRARTE